MAQPLIRPYQAADRAAVRRIVYDTALMGDPIDDQYRDVESLADILSAYYTDHEPENALVAEREDGEVVGYMLSCIDTHKLISPMRYAVRHALLRGVCFRPGTARFYWRAVRDTLADLTTTGRPKIDLDRYPSHTHSNMRADARSGGTGKLLYFELFDRLKAKGSTGMHGEVVAENAFMIKYCQDKLGYSLHGDPYYMPGMRDKAGKRLRIQMVKRDLNSWEIGAWKAKK